MCEIAVLLAVYNSGKYVRELIDSLLVQTESHFTIYVHDDGSTEANVNILKKCIAENPQRIKWLEYPSVGGAKNNFLSMLDRVEADYFMFCDQDDIWMPKKVEFSLSQMRNMEKVSSDPCLVFSDLKVVDQNLKVIDESFMHYMKRDPSNTSVKELIIQNVAAGCTMMINNQLASLARKYHNKDNIFMHDWWCILIAALVGRISYIDEPLVLYRQHDNNTVGASKDYCKWAKTKVRNIFRGTQLKCSRQGIWYQRKTAYELSTLPGITDDDKVYLENIANIDKFNKIKRMRFYRKHKLIKRDIKNFWKILLV